MLLHTFHSGCQTGSIKENQSKPKTKKKKRLFQKMFYQKWLVWRDTQYIHFSSAKLPRELILGSLGM